MKINKTGNNYSEILDKVAQTWSDGAEFEAVNDTDVIGAFLQAVEQMKQGDYESAQKAGQRALHMLQKQTENQSRSIHEDTPNLLDTHPSGDYMSKGPGGY